MKSMIAVMPYATLNSDCTAAFMEACDVAGMTPMLAKVSMDPYAYARLIDRLWQRGRPFTVVEHDVLVLRDTLSVLRWCKQPWCAFPYHQILPGNPVPGLGCTRFGQEVLDRVPPFGWMEDPVIWQNVDSGVGGTLRAYGFVEHVHEPWLRHLKEGVMT